MKAKGVELDLKERRYFCPLPWLHMSSRPNGDYRMCCRVQNTKIMVEDRPAKWGRTEIHKVWNGTYMRSVRESILRDQRLSECAYCHEDEKNGIQSLRQMKIMQFRNESEQILNAGEVIAKLPLEIDLKMGNNCNLSCMMCWPTSSSKVVQEIQGIMEQGFSDERLFSDLRTAQNMDFQWPESQIFESNFERVLPTLRHFQVTGGEPLANKKFLKLLKQLCDGGLAGQIQINITTNLTLMTKEILSQLAEFQEAILNISVDGCGDLYEYIRHPAKWDEWRNRLDLVRKEGLSHNFFITYSNYSISGLTELLDWIRAETGSLDQVQMISLFEPFFLNVSQLPHHAKAELQTQFQKYMQALPESEKHLAPVLSQMWSAPMEFSSAKKFLSYTELRDRRRRKSLALLLPGLRSHYLGMDTNESAHATT